MTCNECRQQLVLAEDNASLLSPAREHLEKCPTCQEFLRDGGRLRLEVRKLAETERAPQELREAVGQLVRGNTIQRRNSHRLWTRIAAAVVLAVLTGYGIAWYYTERALTPRRLAQEFILDHLNYLPGREEIVAGSPREVEQWFEGRVDFAVRVPQVPAAALEDARVCNIAGRKAALLHYRHKPDDTLMSLFVATEPQSFERGRQPMGVFTSYQGLNSTLWCHRGLVYSLVAAVDDTSLEQIANSVRQQEP